jgi:hypothetical protein
MRQNSSTKWFWPVNNQVRLLPLWRWHMASMPTWSAAGFEMDQE